MTPSQKPQDGGAAVRYEPHCDCLGGHVSMVPDPNGRWCRGEVKPLEWTPAGYHGQDLEASAFGVAVAYRVSGKPGDWTLTSIGMREYLHTPGYMTRADAQAAAQADFKARILSALVETDHA